MADCYSPLCCGVQLRSSRFIDAQHLLKLVPHSQLLEVQALLHKHLGDHREALRSVLVQQSGCASLDRHLVRSVVDAGWHLHCVILAAGIFISTILSCTFDCISWCGGCSTLGTWGSALPCHVDQRLCKHDILDVHGNVQSQPYHQLQCTLTFLHMHTCVYTSFKNLVPPSLLLQPWLLLKSCMSSIGRIGQHPEQYTSAVNVLLFHGRVYCQTAW